jgi:hypothetical protein
VLFFSSCFFLLFLLLFGFFSSCFFLLFLLLLFVFFPSCFFLLFLLLFVFFSSLPPSSLRFFSSCFFLLFLLAPLPLPFIFSSCSSLLFHEELGARSSELGGARSLEQLHEELGAAQLHE